MHKPGEIRVLALGLIRDGERIYISQGYDPVKQQTFYRAMGGGVDFGETSRDALQREFLEEIQAELTNIRYLGCLENLFTFNGQQGHEILQVYQCDFVDPKFYELEQVVLLKVIEKNGTLGRNFAFHIWGIETSARTVFRVC
jgi:8-oxo-dGTP pyrophosphatase MutT (NUDIX family)